MKRKRINKKKLTIAIIILLLILLGITIGLYYLLNKKTEPIEHLVYDEFEMIGGKIDDNTYYLLGASDDVSFEVIKEENFSYELTDSEGNKVDSQLIGDSNFRIKGPSTLYEEGKTYHLKLTNGKFKDEKYKDIKEIFFKISRPAKQEMNLKENIIKKDINDLEINDNYLKAAGEYKENDIIVTYDNDKLKGAYKLIKQDGDKYTYSIPKITDMFDDIDYYGKERINLSNYENDKNLNLFLTSFIHTVYAKEDVTISKPVWNKKDGTLEVGIAIYTTGKKEFLVNHDAKVELTLVLSVDLYKDINLEEQNYVTVINYDMKIKNNLNYENDNFTRLFETIKLKDNIENYDTKWLEDSYGGLETDKKSINKSFGKLTIETEVPGLYLDLDLGTLIDMNTKGFVNNLLTSKNTLTVGVNNDKVFSNYTFDNKGELNFAGDESNKIASNINTKLRFMNSNIMDTRITAGLYTDGKSTIKINTEDKKQTKIDYEISGESGAYAKYLVKVNDDEETTIYDNKESLAKYERKIKITSKEKEEGKEKEEEKPKYKYTKEQIKEMLQSGYDELDALEAWTTPMGTLTTMVISQKTINVDGNTFIATWTYDDTASYTCTYNYVTGAMSCEGYSDAVNYVKGTCDTVHDDYLNYLETGEIQNEDAKEWDNLYSDMDACYYEAIPSSEPTNLKEDIQSILDKKELTFDDLGVLKD